jgi:hypothetical protein
MYHEKQKGSYCRCHALNNLIGRELVSLKEFDSYCDAFDKKNDFEIGSSKKKHFFYNNGETDNIFGFILHTKKLKIAMIHYDYYQPKKIKHCKKRTIGYIVYNAGHTYCIRVIDGAYWMIDSMKGKPHRLNDLPREKGIGVIQVQWVSS